MKISFKLGRISVVRLLNSAGEVIYNIPCTSPDAVETAKDLVGSYLDGVDNPESFQLQVISAYQPKKSLI